MLIYLLYKQILVNFLKYKHLNLILVQFPIDIDYIIAFKGVFNLFHFMCKNDPKAKTIGLTRSQITIKSIHITEMLKLLFILGCLTSGVIKSCQKT